MQGREGYGFREGREGERALDFEGVQVRAVAGKSEQGGDA